jgi:hypothetical protein
VWSCSPWIPVSHAASVPCAVALTCGRATSSAAHCLRCALQHHHLASQRKPSCVLSVRPCAAAAVRTAAGVSLPDFAANFAANFTANFTAGFAVRAAAQSAGVSGVESRGLRWH